VVGVKRKRLADARASCERGDLIAFTRAVGEKGKIVGDDYLVTNADRVKQAGFSTIVAARSGETEDVAIVHLAIGWNAGQLKVGSFARSERMAKWNKALRIESRSRLPFAGGAALRRP